MLKRWRNYLPAGLLLAAVVLVVVCLMQPRSFAKLIPMEEAVEFSIHTTGSREQHEIREAFLNREEMEPLLNLLHGGSLRFWGRSRSLEWESGETMYRLYSYREDGLPEDFYLCTDGMVHLWRERIGFAHYRLSNCDMAAIEAELMRLLDIS